MNKIIRFTFAKELTLDEVSEICSTLIKDTLNMELSDMDADEMKDLLEEMSDEDSDLPDFDELIERDEVPEEDPNFYIPVMKEVNNFPVYATGADFMAAIGRINEATGVVNTGLWWEALESCLAKRIGSKSNCLANV